MCPGEHWKPRYGVWPQPRKNKSFHIRRIQGRTPLSPYYTKEETEAQGTVICLQLLSYPDTELGLEAWSMTSEMLGTLSSELIFYVPRLLFPSFLPGKLPFLPQGVSHVRSFWMTLWPSLLPTFLTHLLIILVTSVCLLTLQNRANLLHLCLAGT